MEENNSYMDITINGKKIIAQITVEGETYFIDEAREIYERANNMYYVVTDERIREAVKNVLYKKSDNFMM